MTYRADIDGLRAIAVVAVVLFHLEISSLAGGFVGVDAFFVISGFLITAIIKNKLDDGRFGLGSFYLRRIQRLAPPLLVTILATFAASTILLTPDDFVRFSRSMVAALFSLSNLLFYTETGYWFAQSDLKPLLHTWSLSVEEQFYLLWPGLLIGFHRLSARVGFGRLLAGVTVVGFGLSVFLTGVDEPAAFFLLPARIHQFALGGLASQLVLHAPVRGFISRAGVRLGLFVGGMAGLLYPILTFDEETLFPGSAALVPSLATAAALFAGSGESGQPPIGRWLLENQVANWVGRASYSMYLVHWPIIVLYRYTTDMTLDAGETIGLCLATLVATVGLHYGVERRFYQRDQVVGAERRRTARPVVLARMAAATVCALALLAFHPIATGGWEWRYDTLPLTVAEIQAGHNNRFTLINDSCDLITIEDCALDRPVQLLVFGNSHQPDGFNFLHGALGETEQVDLISFGNFNECVDIERGEHRWVSTVPGCDDRLKRMFDPAIAESVDGVVYASNRGFGDDARSRLMLGLVRDFAQVNPEAGVVVYGGYLNTDQPCSKLIVQTGSPEACAAPEHLAFFDDDPSNEPLYDDFEPIVDYYIDRVGLLCPERRLEACETSTESGVPMYYDEHHISLEFSLESGRRYAEANPDFLEFLGVD